MKTQARRHTQKRMWSHTSDICDSHRWEIVKSQHWIKKEGRKEGKGRRRKGREAPRLSMK
jgi:hypothetical protein